MVKTSNRIIVLNLYSIVAVLPFQNHPNILTTKNLITERQITSKTNRVLSEYDLPVTLKIRG
jgi:hypothetical protein